MYITNTPFIQEHTDVHFIFEDGGVLHAHKAVLCSKNEVFQKHLAVTSPFTDKNEVKNHTTKDVFHDFCTIYTRASHISTIWITLWTFYI